jgi:hypothetical protein
MTQISPFVGSYRQQAGTSRWSDDATAVKGHLALAWCLGHEFGLRRGLQHRSHGSMVDQTISSTTDLPASIFDRQEMLRTRVRELVDYLAPYYILPEPERVGRFVADNESLMGVLLGGSQRIKEHFGVARLELQMIREPESMVSQLYLVIQTGLEPEDALSIFDQLCADWWFEVPYSIQSKMGLRLQYV